MDALAGLLDGPRARGAFLLRSPLDPPWSLRIEDEAPLDARRRGARRRVVLLRRRRDGSSCLGPATSLIIRGPRPYTVADAPATAPQAMIRPGQRCVDPRRPRARGGMATSACAPGATAARRRDRAADRHLPARGRGEPPPAAGAAVTCSCCDAARLGHARWSPLLGDEIVKDEPGQEAVLDRLLDLLLIAALRAWFARPDAAAPAWYRGLRRPGRRAGPCGCCTTTRRTRWTVAALAAETGVSRAALARRFTELVGEPPMTFLTGWRLALAADLLREPDTGLAAVARQVGYATPYALSTAFKRVRGVSPRDYREARV